MKFIIKKIIIVAVFVFCVSPSMSFAANVFVSSLKTANTGETFEVTINASTSGELINSINIILNYNKDLLSFSGYKSEGSMISLWLNSPKEKNGSIYMEGVIPGGVAGLYDPRKDGLGPIPLVKLLFKAKAPGDANFSFQKTEILKHDGKGTQLVHTSLGTTTVINKTTSPDSETTPDLSFVDKVAPEVFEVQFVDASVFSRTPAMIIFQANDLGSGIREYQMNTGNSLWQTTESPQVVYKSFLQKNITIRAIDFYDNYTDSSVEIPGMVSPATLILIIIVTIIFCLISYRVIKYRR